MKVLWRELLNCTTLTSSEIWAAKDNVLGAKHIHWFPKQKWIKVNYSWQAVEVSKYTVNYILVQKWKKKPTQNQKAKKLKATTKDKCIIFWTCLFPMDWYWIFNSVRIIWPCLRTDISKYGILIGLSYKKPLGVDDFADLPFHSVQFISKFRSCILTQTHFFLLDLTLHG